MNWLGYTRKGAEFDVRDELRTMGMTAHTPEKLVFERRGNDRRPRRYTEPVIAQVIFLRGTADHFHRLAGIRELRGYLVPFSDASWRAEVAPFIARCAATYDGTKAALDAGQIADQYRPGQKLLVKRGPFMGQVIEFRNLCRKGDDLWPRLECAGDMFGQAARFRLDPLDVQAAE